MTTIPNLNPLPAVTGDDYLITHDITTNRSGRVSAEYLREYVNSGISSDQISYLSGNVEEQLDKSTRIVPLVSDLATTEGNAGDIVYVKGHTIEGFGGGHFTARSSIGYSTNNGTVVVNGGIAWTRNYDGAVNPIMFGAIPNGIVNCGPAIQAAINFVGEVGEVWYPTGTYYVNSTINLIPQQVHKGFGSIIKVGSGVTAFQRTTDGFPGRIGFHDFRFEGVGDTGKALSIVNNTPFVKISNCWFSNFFKAVELDGSYCSNIIDSWFYGNSYGTVLKNECHSSQFINCLWDANVNAGLAVNGTPTEGSLGSNIHNISTFGCGFQHSPYGVWIESCYDLHMVGTYHEGNTVCDLQLGVADAGAYERSCNSFKIDTWQSASPCASGTNIIIQHSVGGQLNGLSFNSGCSTTATLLSVDGFSDKIELDYHRHSTTTPTSSTPFLFTAPERVVVKNDGKTLYPRGMSTAIKFGTVAAMPEAIYSGNVPSSGRPALFLESLGANQDIVIKVNDIERHLDSANTLAFAIDHLNDSVVSGYRLLPNTDNTVSLGEASNRWTQVWATNGTIQTSDERDKEQISEIPTAWLEAWGDVEYSRFKFKDAVATKGEVARWHIGLIAQRIEAAFSARGLDAFQIGILCYDEWEAKTEDVLEEVAGEYTKVAKVELSPAGNRYGVRYEQALAMECAYLRYKLVN